MQDKFSLNDKEEVPFDFGPADEADPHFLAARFMTSRVINMEVVVRTFKPLWRMVKGFLARDIGSNMLVFAFEDVFDLERVLHGEPWSYDKHLVSFQLVDADTSIAEMECRWSFDTLGVVEKVVESDEERGQEGCIRVREKLDVSQPLCRGRKARLVDGKETLISFKCVEVKVARWSNIPRWGASHHAEFEGVRNSNIPSESGGTSATWGESLLLWNFTKIKESFLDFQEFPCPAVDLGDSRGAWKRVLREKDYNIASGGYPLLSREQSVLDPGLVMSYQHQVVKRKQKVEMVVCVVMWMGTWRRLLISPTSPNEYSKLELSGAWEPRGSSSSSQLGEESRAHSFVSNGNKTRRSEDGITQSKAKVSGGIDWRLIGFYGHPEGHRKCESWALSDKLYNMGTLPWLCVGDFNGILSLEERSGEAVRSMRRIQDFGDVVNRCRLTDLGFRGLFRTNHLGDLTKVISAVNSTVTPKANQNLLCPYTEDEVRVALFQMHPLKAPGPDGRLIIDKISVAFELIHKLKAKRSGRKGEVALKLDMSKAYDRVKWIFLRVNYAKNGLCKEVDFNGDGVYQDSSLFGSHRWEGLTALLRKASDAGLLRGQKINREKTAMFFSSNTSQATRQSIQEFWGSSGSTNFDKYLGLPAMIGQEVLIKVVAQAIPTYAMNCFHLPKIWCDEITSLIARYWWGQKGDERKLHWMKWDKLCTSKEDGGLGFRNLFLFNSSLLAKQC
uniref:DUF4283 domain-containing protein n=1 Tax=Fagus sylvatica TaxID=28930 RepID=A0A2N9I5C2_FAGSY